jgi:NitT/TauT family transport system substrate-binding protein
VIASSAMNHHSFSARAGLSSPLPPRSGGEGLGVGGSSFPRDAAPPTPLVSLTLNERPSPPLRGGRDGASGIIRHERRGWSVLRFAPFAMAAAFCAITVPAQAQTVVRVGWCARTVSSAAAPFAIANKMGWYGSFKVELVPLPGSTDCVKSVATRDLPYSQPSIEPVAIIRPQGVKMKMFYTAYQGNIYGIAVPADSPVKTFADLKGKRIGVTSMASAGVIIARALAAMNGMDPDRDISIVVAGEAAQTAALLRSGQVDALSQFDTQYALTENAGAKLRMLDTTSIDRFPSNGVVALEETLASRRAEAVLIGQGYAKGTVFAIANPEAAIRILWEQFPQTKATGKDEATALSDDIKTLLARAAHWTLESGGVTQWGENSPKNYAEYLDFLVKYKIVKEKVDSNDLITNDLIADINKFDVNEIAAMAKNFKMK